MPLGLSNSPATFQRLMESYLRDLHLRKCLIYIDDIVVFSKTIEEHMENLKEVFVRLRDSALKLKPLKCQFLKEKVKYLGYLVLRKEWR
jgi:hypothetical protein